MIKSPINYMGSKRRLLKQILPLFPDNINTFYDLFAGGGIVSLNTQAKQVYYNDLDKNLAHMFIALSTLPDFEVDVVEKVILNHHDKESFLALRHDYNQGNYHGVDKYVALYVLIILSFNGLPRFNSKGEYNMPYASIKRLTDNYLKTKIDNLRVFIKYVQEHHLVFISKSYDKVISDLSSLSNNDFVYLDPPYSLTDATYMNRGNRWSYQEDKDLIAYMDNLDRYHIKFAMSNVLSHRGTTNEVLLSWLKGSNYTVHHLNMNYSNSTYHTKNGKSDEILVTNY